MSGFEDAESTHNREAFGFVQSLATELTEGTVQLPSYPEAAIRLQRALSAEEVDPALVVRAIGSEPALALRVMQMANSVLLNPMGRQVLDLRTAVSRIGYNMVRTAGVAFIVEQLRNAEALRDLRPQLALLWHESVSVAAFAHVIARRKTRLNADSALLAGLLNGVGKLYILTRLRERPALLAHPEACERILREWHTGVARAILDNWGVPEEVGEAVELYAQPDRELRGAVALPEVLSVAVAFAALRAASPGEMPDDSAVADCLKRESRVLSRLAIDGPECHAILQDTAADIDALHAALDA